MLTEPPAEADRTLGIIPPIVATQPDDVKAVEIVGPFRVRVTFIDGVSGIVDMTELVHSPEAGVFAALADPNVFAQAFVLYGAVTWPGELDLAPDAMYDEIVANGEWVLR
jgi:hypothetical protein